MLKNTQVHSAKITPSESQENRHNDDVTVRRGFQRLKPSKRKFIRRLPEEVEDVRVILRPHTWVDLEGDVS